MKNKFYILLAAFLFLFVFSQTVLAEEAKPLNPASPDAFTLIVVGTKHFSDVDVIQKNVQKIAGMRNLSESVASQNHLQFAGNFAGNQESLIADIKSLAADRFDVQIRNDKNSGLIITLRKISNQPSS